MNQHFCHFPTLFSTLLNTEILTLAAFNLSSSNVLNFVQSRKLIFSKTNDSDRHGGITISLQILANWNRRKFCPVVKCLLKKVPCRGDSVVSVLDS